MISPEEPRPVLRRRRGRPPAERTRNDGGTPELQRKKRQGQTAETLDACLARGMITERQHWCGIHLRWLHTLRHGAPGVRALDLSDDRGPSGTQDGEQWRASREAEYCEALRALSRSGHAGLLLSLCVYDERPAPLRPGASWPAELAAGLELLARHWRAAPITGI